jgi:hypothetical protein
VVNTKKALRNWQVLPDKVKQVQDLVGQEELVHPSPRVLLLSPPSSWQSTSKNTPPLEPLKTKMTARIAARDCRDCSHPKEMLALGANQHTAWVSCTERLSRWSAPEAWRQPKKNTTAQSKSKASPPKKSTANSAEDRFDANKLESEMMAEMNRQKHSLERKYQTEKELDMNRLKAELMEEMMNQAHTPQQVAMTQLTSEISKHTTSN